jgi:hypothetical protein
MYRCDNCGKNSQPNETLNKSISKKRQREYYTLILRHKRNGNKIVVYHKLTQEELDTFRKENFDIASEKYTKGWEIEQESKLCNQCYETVSTDIKEK